MELKWKVYYIITLKADTWILRANSQSGTPEKEVISLVT